MTYDGDNESADPSIDHRRKSAGRNWCGHRDGLAQDGWNVATTYWRPYDERARWGSDPSDAAWLSEQLAASGAMIGNRRG